jgi:hypothetical protein
MLNNSSTSSLASSTATNSSNDSQSSSVWKKITKLLQPHKKRRNSNTSGDTISDESLETIDSQRRQRKPLVQTTEAPSPHMVIPPFSPTYCKANEFPYSNFYIKLPDGRWMIKYRDGNREVLRTDIMEGYMI